MSTQPIRPAAVAGLFYPADPPTLRAQLHTLLGQAERGQEYSAPKALIVPHAGYMYSGPIAASAYALLEPLRDVIRRVILLGPSHHHAFAGIALPGCVAFETPLGSVDLDSEAVFSIAQRPDVIFDDRAHAQEHSLEVQLPFLQSTLDHFQVLPLVLGVVEPAAVASLLETLWGGPETLIVVSSDLSHYHAYTEAQDKDQTSIDQILKSDARLSHSQACGATGVNALLLTAKSHHLGARLLDLRNSGDTAGERSRVVGYAAVSFTPEQVHLH